MNRNPLSPVLAVLLTMSLGACGYQLRGQASLPAEMTRTAISAPQPRGDLVRQLTLVLSGNQVEVVTKADNPGAVLRISEDRFARTVQSIGATARVREFALHYSVRFKLETGAGEELLAEQHLELTEDYQFDQQQVLGTASEEELIRKDMVRSMSRQILRRLELAGRR